MDDSVFSSDLAASFFFYWLAFVLFVSSCCLFSRIWCSR